MIQVTLNFLLIGSILCPPIIGAAAEADRVQVVCDQEHEFLCPNENKCIAKTKLCNFVDDCEGGVDEELCGECEFSMNPPEECGLTMRADRAFAWHRKEPIGDYPVFFDSSDPQYYVELDLNETMKQYINLHKNHENLIHKPKIIFPHLRPTNSDKCQAVIRMRITEHASSQLTIGLDKGDNLEAAYWPGVSLLIVEPKQLAQSWPGELFGGRENRKYKSIDLQVKGKSASRRGQWLTYSVPLGSHRTVWSLELIVEASIRSCLVHISSIEYKYCAPKVDDNVMDNHEADEAATDVPLDNVCNNYSQFRCELSGLCIDKSLLCDFGHDCGENDNSDEEFCDDFPGRCNFEDDNSLCDWSQVDDQSWIQMSAKYEDQAFYGRTLSRPAVDHTYQSKISGGRYLLLNETQLELSTQFTLLGPHVTLNPGAQDCWFRFWSNTPAKLDSKVITTPCLTVGRSHLTTDGLFSDNFDDHWSANDGWRRHEILLLDRFNIEESNIFALKVSFRNFSLADLRLFKQSNGYLALDDFSFSPGCHLVYHGPALENTCGNNHFFCRIPTPTTGAQCIPMQNYCDFKSDCGLDDSLNLWADDELDCLHECSFGQHHYPHHQHQTGCSALDIQDGLGKRRRGEFNHDDEINEAFNWTVKDEKLLIEAQGEKFLAKQKVDSDVIRLSTNRTRLRTMSNLEIHFPTFSESHSNCSFEITYQWSKQSENIQASIYIESEAHSSSFRAELKRLIPDEDQLSRRFGGRITRVEFGIGNQRYPFKLVLDIYYSDNLLSEKPHSGSLSIYSYRFLNCAFPAGSISSEKSVEFKSIEDDREDDEMSVMDYLDYQNGPAVDYTCETGYFQCKSPILCIPLELVCDMQLDCQGSGADEQQCTSDKQRNWLQYNFDDATGDDDDGGEDDHATSGCKPLTVTGWCNDNNNGPKWHVTSGAGDRSTVGAGPPYDHTQSNYNGKYLATKRAASSGNATAGSMASLRSARFISSAQCSRLVFYIYFWGTQLNKFQVLKQVYFDLDDEQQQQDEMLLYELRGGNDSKSAVDAWRRVSIEMETNDSLTRAPAGKLSHIKEFGLIFRAFSGAGPSDLIALDDISFGPFCLQSPLTNGSSSSSSSADNKPLDTNVTPDDNDGGSSIFAGWLKAGVIVLVVAMLVMVSAGLEAKNLLHLRSSWVAPNAANNNNQEASHHLQASGFTEMELSLENLGGQINGDQSIFCSSTTSLIDTLDESRQHQL